jgi:hypothetical protein
MKKRKQHAENISVFPWEVVAHELSNGHDAVMV